jgi:hypothetical protein
MQCPYCGKPLKIIDNPLNPDFKSIVCTENACSTIWLDNDYFVDEAVKAGIPAQ